MIHAREDYNNRPLDSFIPADEPVFLLRAKDMLAPYVVRFWADLLEKGNGDARAVELARKHASVMEQWKGRKMPDMPKEAKAGVV